MSQQTGRGRAYWAPLVEAYHSHPEVSQREFCRRRGISYRNFGRWLRKLRAERDQPGSVERRFVEIELPAQPTAPLVRVQLGRVTVDFETLPPPAWIAELAHYGGA
jgi:hypothetical protein